jgi:hypothetical protein
MQPKGDCAVGTSVGASEESDCETLFDPSSPESDVPQAAREASAKNGDADQDRASPTAAKVSLVLMRPIVVLSAAR